MRSTTVSVAFGFSTIPSSHHPINKRYSNTVQRNRYPRSASLPPIADCILYSWPPASLGLEKKERSEMELHTCMPGCRMACSPANPSVKCCDYSPYLSLCPSLFLSPLTKIPILPYHQNLSSSSSPSSSSPLILLSHPIFSHLILPPSIPSSLIPPHPIPSPNPKTSPHPYTTTQPINQACLPACTLPSSRGRVPTVSSCRCSLAYLFTCAD